MAVAIYAGPNPVYLVSCGVGALLPALQRQTLFRFTFAGSIAQSRYFRLVKHERSANLRFWRRPALTHQGA